MNLATIQDTAIKTLLVNNGASMQDIALAAGIGRTTLHRYFANREDLLRTLLSWVFDDIERAMIKCQLEDGTALEVLERLVSTFVPIGHRFQFLLGTWPLDEHEQALKVRETRLLAQLESVIRQGQYEGVLRTDLPVHWMINTLTALIFMSWESISEGYTQLGDASQLVMTTLVGGIGK